MPLFLLLLFILGSIFGSFSTVLIERWRNKKGGIMTGRSECPQCHHTLSARELIPIFSYIFQNGKCHNCHAKIPLFYPFVEIFFGCIFMLTGYASFFFSVEPIQASTIVLLILTFITGVYIIYDIRYMEIPDQIMIPGIFLYIILFILGYFSGDIQNLFFDSRTYRTYNDFVYDHVIAAVVIYSFFYLQILLPGGFYLGRRKKWKELIELLGSYFLFPFMLLFGQFFPKKEETSETMEEEIPTWIGGGDLRVALFIGLTLGMIHTITTLFIAYILGSIVGIGLILFQKKQNSQIPFGPFLGIGWILSIFFYTEIYTYFFGITNF